MITIFISFKDKFNNYSTNRNENKYNIIFYSYGF